GREHLVQTRLLDVEDLAAQREDRLRAAVAALLGAATGAVALDDEELGVLWVALLAVGQLAGQRQAVEHALSRDRLAGLAGGRSRARREDRLFHDRARRLGVFLELARQLVGHRLRDEAGDLAGDELVL